MATRSVRFGVYLPQVAFTFDEMLERARLCEELGFDSLWLMDHLYPPELPGVGSFEAWTLATALLARTTRLRVGHLVLSATLRHPALLAKMATSLDVISGGRLELGVGSGSYAAEHHRAGIPYGTPRERALQLGETLETLAAAFRRGEPTDESELPNLPPPVQVPHPPIHVGGVGERFVLPLVARYADVWNCPTYALAELEKKRDVLAELCAREGRDPDSIETSLEAVLALAESADQVPGVRALAERRFGGPGWGLEEGGFIGTPDEIVARIAHFVERGVSLFIFFFHDRAAAGTLRLFAERVMPRFAA